MKGMQVFTNVIKEEPYESECKVTGDQMPLEETLIHIATCMQGLAQSLGGIVKQLQDHKASLQESNNAGIEAGSIPNDK